MNGISEIGNSIETDLVQSSAEEFGICFRTIVENTPVPTIIVSLDDGQWLYANQAARGNQSREFFKRQNHSLMSLCANDDDFHTLWKSVQSGQPLREHHIRLQKSDDELYWAILSAMPIKFGGKKASLVNYVDVSSQKEREETLHRMANHDPLTGLANRSVFLKTGNREISIARRQVDYQFAVLFIDLNQFKTFNDTYGHGAGDKLLVEFSDRLQKSVRPSDLVARMGGDEFTVLLTHLQGDIELPCIVRRISDALHAPYFIEGRHLSPSASIGVATYDPDFENVEAMLRRADAAMYREKAKTGDYRAVANLQHA
jgi:diguanylate cyclase (GGDEF)-like protein/PAS domain S-box-containing protein